MMQLMTTASTMLLLLLAMSSRTSAAIDVGDCDLFDSAALGRCLKRLLEQSRGKVRQESDPLHLPNHHDDALSAEQIVVKGLAGYSVPQLSVTFPDEMKIAISAQISWPHLTGDMFVRMKKCKRVFRKKFCASVSARPHIKIRSATGRLTTTLQISIEPDGRLQVQPSGTAVTLHLASLKVETNIQSKAGRFIDKLFGRPSNYISTRLANNWWGKNKAKVEGKARSALDNAVREDLSVNLADLLKLAPEPEPTEPAPAPTQPAPALAPLEMRSGFNPSIADLILETADVPADENADNVDSAFTSPPGMRCVLIEDSVPSEAAVHTEIPTTTEQTDSSQEEPNPTGPPGKALKTSTDPDGEETTTENVTTVPGPKMRCVPIEELVTTATPAAADGVNTIDVSGPTEPGQSTAAPEPTAEPQ